MSYLSEQQASQTRRLILITGVATTLAVWTSLADPVNVPKMFVLAILSAWILGVIITASISEKRIKFSLGQWAVIVFSAGILLAALLTDVRYTAFFGASHRNDGALSYLALATLCMAGMMSFGTANIKQIRTSLLITGSVLAGYGFLQTTGHDPFKWVIVYGPVIGTLGNPDFVSGIIGASSIATLWVIFTKEKPWLRVLGIIVLLLELFIIKRTGSVQGFVAFAVGLALLAVARFWQIDKRYGLVSTILAGFVSVAVLLGLVNKGPLAAKIYQSTLRNRLDYWHGAINMFKAHPIVGVGLDRFGENYGQYAPQVQIVQGQTTDNAHNVFLQLLATGGLLVILPYLFLLAVIFIMAIRGVRATTGQLQIDIVALFSIWFSLLLISSISIDNLGVGVWFWISGGVLYGVAYKSIKVDGHRAIGKEKSGKLKQRPSSNNAIYISPIVSLLLTVFALILMIPTWRTSAMLADLQQNKGGLSHAQYVARVNQVSKIQPSNVQTLISLSDLALRIPEVDLALSFTKTINEKDPRSFYGNYLSAVAYEVTNRFDRALPFRVRLLEIDPWNTKNMLELMKDYIQVKDFANARAIATKISHLYPNSDDAKTAVALVKG